MWQGQLAEARELAARGIEVMLLPAPQRVDSTVEGPLYGTPRYVRFWPVGDTGQRVPLR